MAGTRWVKIDTSYLRNPKITAVSAQARLLHLASIMWSADQLTNGHIPTRTLTELARSAGISGPAAASKRAAELEAAGLWETNGVGGWHVHDFEVMNPQALRKAVEEQRAKWKEWQDRHRGSRP